jgi:hypothetical protein
MAHHPRRTLRLIVSGLVAAALLCAACGGGGPKSSTMKAPQTSAGARPPAGVTGPATPMAQGDVAAVDYRGVQHQRYR